MNETSTQPTTSDAKDRPGVIAPPPLIYIGFLAIGFGLGWLWPLALGFGEWRYPAAAMIFVAGGVIAIAGVRQFKAAGTSFDVLKPDTALLDSGLYRYSRNPLYVSLTLAYLSIALAINSGWAMLLVVPALAVMRYGVIAREERYLASKFDEPYARYKATVRRWI